MRKHEEKNEPLRKWKQRKKTRKGKTQKIRNGKLTRQTGNGKKKET